jgi:hypothetical protein
MGDQVAYWSVKRAVDVVDRILHDFNPTALQKRVNLGQRCRRRPGLVWLEANTPGGRAGSVGSAVRLHRCRSATWRIGELELWEHMTPLAARPVKPVGGNPFSFSGAPVKDELCRRALANRLSVCRDSCHTFGPAALRPALLPAVLPPGCGYYRSRSAVQSRRFAVLLFSFRVTLFSHTGCRRFFHGRESSVYPAKASGFQ